MEMKKLFALTIAFLFLVITLNLVSASVNVNFNTKYAIIENETSITYTSTDLSSYSTKGYVCNNADCTLIGNQIAGLTGTTSGNTITLTFPTTMPTTHGYAIYFYKNEYIGGLLKGIKIYGTSSQTITSPNPIYLYKKRTGSAPIMNLNVLNEIEPNTPIQIGLQVGIDADTYSALNRLAPAGIDLENDYVRTRINLEIRDSTNNVIYSDTETVDIDYSGSVSINFTYSGFTNEGDYIIKVYTDVLDNKIINSVPQNIQSNVQVISQSLVDYRYGLVNGLRYDPEFPEIGDQVNFSFEYITNYVDTSGNLHAVPAIATVRMYRNGTYIGTEIHNLPAGSTTQPTTYSILKTFNETGAYTFEVSVAADTLQGTQSVENSQSVSFNVGEEININVPGAPLVVISSPVRFRTYNTVIIPLQVSANQTNLIWKYSLNNGANITFIPNTSISVPLGTNVLRVYATNSENKTGMARVTFYVVSPAGPGLLPQISVTSPINGRTYGSTSIPLNIAGDLIGVVFMYSLNGGANVTFTPNTHILAREGSNNLIVYATNVNGTIAIPVNFRVNLHDNDEDDEDEDDENWGGDEDELIFLHTEDEELIADGGDGVIELGGDSSYKRLSIGYKWLLWILIALIILLLILLFILYPAFWFWLAVICLIVLFIVFAIIFPSIWGVWVGVGLLILIFLLLIKWVL